MNILIIPSDGLPMPPVQGGAVQTLIDDFLKWNEDTELHNITVYSIFDKFAEKEGDKYSNVIFKYININPFWKNIRKLNRKILKKIFKVELAPQFVSQICKDISDQQYDLIIVENVIEYGFFIKKITDTPIILHLHNEYFKPEKTHNLKYMDAYNEIVTVSEYIKKSVLACSDKTKVEVLYNGIDTSLFNYTSLAKKKYELRKFYGIDEEAIVILFSARLCADKGALELVSAFVKAQFSRKVTLLIVGSKVYGKNKKDRYLDEIQKIADIKENDIIFTGYVPHSDIPKLCALADVGVLPSIFDDPCPLTLIEYITMGLPVIITRSGGMPEIANSRCAFILERDKDLIQQLSISMMKLCENSILREKMSRESLKLSEYFNKERYCEDFNNIVNDYRF